MPWFKLLQKELKDPLFLSITFYALNNEYKMQHVKPDLATNTMHMFKEKNTKLTRQLRIELCISKS